MTNDLALPDLMAELETALQSGDLALDRLDAESFGLDFDALTPDDFTLETQIQTRIHAPAKSRMLHPRLVRYENAQELSDNIVTTNPLSEPGSSLHAYLSGNFIFGDFIEAWIIANNWSVPDLHITTLSLSGDNIDSLANLLHGNYVQRLHLHVSDYWFAHERRNLVPYAYEELDLGGDRFQLVVTGSHAKVCLIAPAEGGHYVLHGSANLRSSSSTEQLAFDHSPDLYAFYLETLQALEAQYHTIHPQQPGPAAPKRLQWEAVHSPKPMPNAARQKKLATPKSAVSSRKNGNAAP